MGRKDQVVDPSHMTILNPDQDHYWCRLQPSNHLGEKDLKNREHLQRPRLLQHHKITRLDFKERTKHGTWRFHSLVRRNGTLMVLMASNVSAMTRGPTGDVSYGGGGGGGGGGAIMVFRLERWSFREQLAVWRCCRRLQSWLRTSFFNRTMLQVFNPRLIKDFFQKNDVTVLDHPASSPDLNPAENICWWMGRQVYRNGHQFQTVDVLHEAIFSTWTSLLETLTTLKLILKVIQKTGGAAH